MGRSKFIKINNVGIFLQVRKVLLQWLPWILRMKRPGKKLTRRNIVLNNKMHNLQLKQRSSKSLLANVLDIDDDFRQIQVMALTPNSSSYSKFIGRSYEDGGAPYSLYSSYYFHSSKDLMNILSELRYITSKIKDSDDQMEIKMDWKFAAMVVDRLCLITFSLYTLIATVVIMLSAPHILI